MPNRYRPLRVATGLSSPHRQYCTISASTRPNKYGSTAGKYQEIEGPPIAEPVLREWGLSSEIIEHVCKIIANHHSARDIDTIEFRVIWDADWLVNIPDECGEMAGDKLKGFIEKIFKTNTGRQLAKEIFLNGDR